TREALCALGNGYFETRGAAPWATADGVHYPGTYIAGGYNRLRTDIAGRTVENEDLVNFPNWLSLSFRHADGDWFDLRAVRLLDYRQELDLRRGRLLRRIRFEDPAGRRSVLEERRFVSMDDMHLAGLELSITAENWSGELTARRSTSHSRTSTSSRCRAATPETRGFTFWSARISPAFMSRSLHGRVRRSTASVSGRKSSASRRSAISPRRSTSLSSKAGGSR